MIKPEIALHGSQHCLPAVEDICFTLHQALQVWPLNKRAVNSCNVGGCDDLE